jgi:Lysozyme like domain
MAAATDTGALSYAQLKGVWLNASDGSRYHTNAWASLMAAIAEAESGGRPDALNPDDNGGTQTSWGLWQISLGNHEAPASNWADPSENAKLAIGKLDSQGLTAWGTYDSGAYKAYLSDRTAATLTDIPVGPDHVTQSALTSAAAKQASCAWGIASLVPNPSLLGYHPLGSFQGQICILSKSQARAIIGVALLGTGLVTVLFGAGWIIKGAALSLAGPAAAVLAPEALPAVAAGQAAASRSATRGRTSSPSGGTSPAG